MGFDRNENDEIIWNEKSNEYYRKMTMKVIEKYPDGINLNEN